VETWLDIPIEAQPNDETCGPTCLHAVYRYYGLDLPLDRVIAEVARLAEGGTLAVLLGTDALRRGFAATIFTYNLLVFDPTWFQDPAVDLREKLLRQREAKTDAKLRHATDAYLHFLELGGEIRYADLTASLLRRHLERGTPVLTGLSATYLYGSARERVEGERLLYDDVRGHPQGHFVVLCGYEKASGRVGVADPFRPNPLGRGHIYDVEFPHLLNAILLGIVTYDANMLVVRSRDS